MVVLGLQPGGGPLLMNKLSSVPQPKHNEKERDRKSKTKKLLRRRIAQTAISRVIVIPS
jgi:hypothetical protein